MDTIVLADPQTGRRCGVSSDGRLLSTSVTSISLAKATIDGDSFDVSTGVINNTSSDERLMLYIRNNHPDKLLRPARVSVSLGRALGTSNTDVIFRAYDASRAVLSATGVEPLVKNRRLGERHPPDVVAKVGAFDTPTTWQNAELITPIVLQTASRSEFTTEIILDRQGAIMFTIQAPGGTASLALVCYVVAELVTTSW